MAIRESIVFELDASGVQAGAAQAETAFDRMGAAAGRAQTKVDGASTSATATEGAWKRASGSIDGVSAAYLGLESKATRAVETVTRSTRGVGDVARAAGEPMARLVGIFAGPEVGAGVARLFAVEKGIQAIGQVATAAGTGLGRFLGPLAVGAIAIEGISFAINSLSKAFERQAVEAADAAKATEDFARATEVRLRSLSGDRRESALEQAVARAKSSIAELGNLPQQEFTGFDALKSELDTIDKKLRGIAELQEAVNKAGPESRLAFVAQEFLGERPNLERRRANLTNQRAVIGGQEFVPTAGLKAIAEGIPELTDAIAQAEAKAVPGLIALADALSILDEAGRQTESSGAQSKVREVVDGLRAETDALLERRLAIEEAIVSGASLEEAISAGNRAQAEAAALAQLGADATDAQAEAVKRAAAAYFDAETKLETYLERQREIREEGERAAQEADRNSRSIIEAAEKQRDAQARTAELERRQAQDRERQESGRTAGAIAGGIGDAARAARDGENPALAAAQGISERIFELSIQRLEQSFAEMLAPLFGGTAFNITPGEQQIVQAIERNTAAVQSSGGKGDGGGSGGSSAAGGGGFNWGGLALGALGLGLGFLSRGRGGSSGSNDSGAGRAVINRGVTNQNRVTINNYASGPGRIRETDAQRMRNVRGFIR